MANGAKKPPGRAAGGFGSDLRNGGDGGHGQDDQTQHDAVKTEELEVMALDVIHQEADGGKLTSYSLTGKGRANIIYGGKETVHELDGNTLTVRL